MIQRADGRRGAKFRVVDAIIDPDDSTWGVVELPARANHGDEVRMVIRALAAKGA